MIFLILYTSLKYARLGTKLQLFFNTYSVQASMPWLFSFDRSAERFGLCDFLSMKQNCSHKLKISPEYRKFITSSHGLEICTSKHGWLLLSKLDRFSTKVDFLFCNPFYNKIIELPWLYLDVGERVVKSMINAIHPALAGKDSDDCVIFIMSIGRNNRIHTCNPRSRNKKWTSHLVSGDFRPSTYMNGTLYSLYMNWYRTELIGMFGIANQDYSGVVTRVYSSSSLQGPEERFGYYELFESNGELLLAIRYYKSYQFGSYYWRVYQFDPLRKDNRNHWIPIESLGNRILAISIWRCDFSRDCLVVVVHEAKECADMIIDGNTTFIRETDDRGSFWRKDKDHEWNFMRRSVTYIEPILFA